MCNCDVVILPYLSLRQNFSLFVGEMELFVSVKLEFGRDLFFQLSDVLERDEL